jgi:hypothetical protein
MVAASPAVAGTPLAAVCCNRAAMLCAPAAMQAALAASPSVEIRSAAAPAAESGSKKEACLASPERWLAEQAFFVFGLFGHFDSQRK